MHAQTASIATLSSFKNNGTITHLYIAKSVDELKTLRRHLPTAFPLGKGSNTLLNSNSHRPLIKLHPDFSEPLIEGDILTANAAFSVNRLLTLCKKAGLSGLEFAAGVPASLGGMIAMNFGCWGTEIAERVHAVEVMDSDGKCQWLAPEALGFAYRHSQVSPQNLIVTQVKLALTNSSSTEIDCAIENSIQKRLAHQPLRANTFGSIFKNPGPQTAGQLIDSAGLKSRRVGDAMISEQHANFMCNQGKASFEDATRLIQDVTAVIQEQAGITLQTEVKIVA